MTRRHGGGRCCASGFAFNSARPSGVEVGDFVAQAFAADFFERRFEAAGDELFVEAWGAHKPIMNDEL